ncbi:heavy metal sensor histidine kinase [Pseudoduganella umbonata]|nr:heavy metal sensor histidine kinase [Pseudoduganella umbonata]QCP15024.1 heavy metal sensor histidine kinase [Pseudoduganella umbonata]
MARLRDSLAARVTATFVLVAALAAAGLGTWLYLSFVAEIERRDDIALLGKLRQIQLLLGRPGAPALLRTQPDLFRDTMSGQENSLVRFVGADGTVLADINAAGERYPVPPAAASPAPDRAAIASWTSRRGDPGRVVAGTARLGSGTGTGRGASTVTVIVARVYADRTAMFAEYRRRIAGAAAIAALVAALCGAWMLHRGLRPLRVLAEHAALVRPGTLDRRIAAAGAPSELQPLIGALNAMLARLQEGYARLSGFSADLAHEFRTPVANLLGQSQVMLAQPRSAAEYESLVASNIEELERLARMIESMLFLARAEQDEVAPASRPLQALDELSKVAGFFEGMAEERGLRLACAGGGEVLADPALLRRALANLLSNAVRHADAGSTIHLRAEADGGSTALSVENTGTPIGPEHLPYLFERFYRADAARNHAGGSTGLGLSIVRAIMALHGGSAAVHTDAARTRFTLHFPAVATPAPGSQRPDTARQ